MTATGGIAASATRPVTRQPAEPAGVDGRPLRAGDEGWEDAVLIWNGTVAVVPELRQDAEQRGIRRRG